MFNQLNKSGVKKMDLLFPGKLKLMAEEFPNDFNGSVYLMSIFVQGWRVFFVYK